MCGRCTAVRTHLGAALAAGGGDGWDKRRRAARRRPRREPAGRVAARDALSKKVLDKPKVLLRVGVLQEQQYAAERQAAAKQAVEVGKARREQRLAVQARAQANLYTPA